VRGKLWGFRRRRGIIWKGFRTRRSTILGRLEVGRPVGRRGDLSLLDRVAEDRAQSRMLKMGREI
jgi:hypothetical protein